MTGGVVCRTRPWRPTRRERAAHRQDVSPLRAVCPFPPTAAECRASRRYGRARNGVGGPVRLAPGAGGTWPRRSVANQGGDGALSRPRRTAGGRAELCSAGENRTASSSAALPRHTAARFSLKASPVRAVVSPSLCHSRNDSTAHPEANGERYGSAGPRPRAEQYTTPIREVARRTTRWRRRRSDGGETPRPQRCGRSSFLSLRLSR